MTVQTVQLVSVVLVVVLVVIAASWGLSQKMEYQDTKPKKLFDNREATMSESKCGLPGMCVCGKCWPPPQREQGAVAWVEKECNPIRVGYLCGARKFELHRDGPKLFILVEKTIEGDKHRRFPSLHAAFNGANEIVIKWLSTRATPTQSE